MSLSPDPLQGCLRCNPFEGDRDAGAVLLSDRVVTARVSHACHTCLGKIRPGERSRARREIYDGRGVTYRWCAVCCLAQARSFHDGGRSLERRYTLGQRRADRIRAARKRRAA